MSEALGIDVGGTFTDLVHVDEAGGVTTAKVPSTPEDQSVGVFDGVDAIAAKLDRDRGELLTRASYLVHGTTVATNTMLEFNGAEVGLLTTRGFRDVIDVRRGFKEADFDLRLPAPRALVPRRRRLGVPERIDANGSVLEPLDEAETVAAIERLVAQGVGSVAVCYLFSFVNPAHELRTRELIAEVAADLHVSLSHQVLPRVREFERLSTTVVDAYVTPQLSLYLGSLERSMRENGFLGELFIVAANGGMLPISRAASFGAQLVLSGPAGGVTAGAAIARDLDAAGGGEGNAITADMGGTSYDVCLIERGTPVVNSDAWMSRYRIAVPTLDIRTIGAGGGSIAWVDPAGRLAVGPASAGARPGPACFGRGGERPTVTDANLYLGYLSADVPLGGSIALDREAAERALLEHVAGPLGTGVTEAAAGVSRIVNNAMANGIREISIARGHDPRDFTLLSFGGASAIHASRQASELGIGRVVVPKMASVLCALGDVMSDILISRNRGFYARVSSADPAEIEAAIRAAAGDGLDDVSGAEGAVEIEIEAFLEMHYVAQSHELTVPASIRVAGRGGGEPAIEFDAECLAATVAAFHALHERLYTFSKPGEDVEILGVRADVRGVRPKPALRLQAAGEGRESPEPDGFRQVYFEELGDFAETAVHHGEGLRPGDRLDGPAVIHEPDTTLVVYPADRLSILPDGSYDLRVGDRAQVQASR